MILRCRSVESKVMKFTKFSYVLLHHVLGGTDGHRGVWAFAIGGMGAVSQAIARSALEAKAQLYTNAVFSYLKICLTSAFFILLTVGCI